MDTFSVVAGPALGLFGKTRCAVMGLLFGHPDEKFYLRQISRLANVGLGALQRELRTLEAAGIVTSTRLARSVFFQANASSPIYPELLGLVTKTMGASALLRSALADLQTRIGVAFIYGSLAAKTHDAKSDIDVFIVGDVRTRDVMARIDPLEQSLRREVNPSVMSPAEFRTRLANEDPFVCDVVLGPRLYLVGGDHELGDLAGRTIGETPQHKPTRD